MEGFEQYPVQPAHALDPARIRELRAFTREELAELVTEVIRSISVEIAAAQAAARSGDMRQLGLAAHAGKNEALMVGARELAEAFGRMEQASNAGDVGASRQALADVVSAWSAVRSVVERLAAHSDSG